jgi:hypothetical protein
MRQRDDIASNIGSGKPFIVGTAGGIWYLEPSGAWSWHFFWLLYVAPSLLF